MSMAVIKNISNSTMKCMQLSIKAVIETGSGSRTALR